ncbi:MAG: branched-chain amino acid ABC transporter permease [Kiloniella sp.]|nr:branched-chain amino acid ABC transporter permease [Kiloniella sp.]RZO32471.1 MAG: branched-chain amino acid ABC transporter permease [Rhodospirillaceae bacterium]
MWDAFGFEFINFYLIPGLVLGCIYALGAIGITLTFGILRFANFAHGEVMMSSAYLTYTFMALAASFGLSLVPLVAAIPAAVLTIAIALLIDHFFYRPFRKSETIIIVMASFGMMLMVRALVPVIWGPNQITFVRGITPMKPYLDGMLLVQDKQWLIVIGTVVVMTLFSLLMNFTRIGKAMRAVSDSPDLARVTGINVETVIRATWIIGGFCAAVAGVFLAMNTQQLSVTMGFRMLLPMFAAAILGGIGRPVGAIVGGMVIGLAEELIAYPWQAAVMQLVWWFSEVINASGMTDWAKAVHKQMRGTPLLSPGYKAGVAFGIMVIMLIVRPAGLFKGRVF